MYGNPVLPNAWWLALRQMRDNWPAYPLTALYFLVMGRAFSQGDTASASVGHIILMFILVQPSLSLRNMSWRKDNEVVRHQMFLQGLPVPARVKVVSSLIASLVAGMINVPIYFGVMWLSTDWNVNARQFLAFAVFWVGIAVACTGAALVQEVMLDLRQWAIFNLGVLGLVVAVLVVLILTTDFDPIRFSLNAGESQPALMVLAGVAIAIAGLTVSVTMATRVYRTRDFMT